MAQPRKWQRCVACRKRVPASASWDILPPETGPEATDTGAGSFCSWACVAVTCEPKPDDGR